jgi:hypothetical protein
MRLRNFVVLAVILSAALALNACKGKQPEPPKQTSIAPPDVHVGDDMQVPPPVAPAGISIRGAGSGEMMYSGLEGLVGSRKKLIDLAQLMVLKTTTITKPGSGDKLSAEKLIAYAVLQPDAGGVLARDGVLCFFDSGLPMRAITTRTLDYRTGQKVQPRRYSDEELLLLSSKLIALNMVINGKAGIRGQSFVLIMSDSFREAAIEVTYSRYTKAQGDYFIKNMGATAVIVSDFNGQQEAIAADIFPAKVHETRSDDADGLLSNPGTVY